MAALATPDRISNKIGEPIETVEEVALAEEMLESASNWVRMYAGQPDWTAASAPDLAVTIVIAAASRGYMNPAGYLEERADVAFVKRSAGWSNEAKLLPDEIAALKNLNTSEAPINSIQSARVSDPDRFIPRSAYRVRAARYRFGWTEPPPLDLSEFQ